MKAKTAEFTGLGAKMLLRIQSNCEQGGEIKDLAASAGRGSIKRRIRGPRVVRLGVICHRLPPALDSR
jgi:hypothetical protein